MRSRMLPDQRIVAIEDRDVVARLRLEDALLGAAVIGKARIAVQMVFGDVEQNARCAAGTRRSIPTENC